MRRRPERSRRLAAALLAPLLSLSVVATLAVAGLAEVSGGRVAQAQVQQRGDGVLHALDQRLRDRQKAKQVYADLVATDRRLVEALESGDPAALAERLVPLRARLGLGLIHLYDSQARPLLSLGQRSGLDGRPLISAALAGLSEARVAATEGGVAVMAAAPMKGARGVIGAVIMGTVLVVLG